VDSVEIVTSLPGLGIGHTLLPHPILLSSWASLVVCDCGRQLPFLHTAFLSEKKKTIVTFKLCP